MINNNVFTSQTKTCLQISSVLHEFAYLLAEACDRGEEFLKL